MPADTVSLRILITRLSALGDVIQTLPVLSAIRETYPAATIGWLVEAEAADLLQGHPLIDQIHISHRKQWLKSLKNPLQWRRIFREIRQWHHAVRTVEYDVAMDCQGLLKSAVLMWLTGIRQRIGFAAAREGAAWFYTHRVSLKTGFFDPNVALLDHMLALLHPLNCSTSGPKQYILPPVNPAIHNRVQDLLSPLMPHKPMVVLAPATQWESKHWLPEHWGELLWLILEQTDWNVLLIGGKGDRDKMDALLPDTRIHCPSETRMINLAGRTSLPELQCLFEQVDMLVGLDSAPLHLAAAVGHARVIGIYGPTSIYRTPPPMHPQVTLLSTQGTLDCQPCNEARCPLKTGECMQQITPKQVFEALLLKQSAASGV